MSKSFLLFLSQIGSQIFNLDLLPSAQATETTDVWPNEYPTLHNMFTSIDEVPKMDLQFTNKPDWLDGDLYLMGPGKFSWGDKTYRGFMDATSMTTKISFNQKTKTEKPDATFQRSMTKGVTYQTNNQANSIIVTEMMTYAEPENLITDQDSPAEGMKKRMDYYNDNLSDNAIVKVYKLYNKIFQFGEIMTTNVLDEEDLSYQFGINLNDAPALSDRYEVIIQGAHGVHIEERNEFINHVTLLDFGNLPIPTPPKIAYAMYKYHKTNETLTKEEILNNIEFSQPFTLKTDMDIMYFHEPAPTENYFVFPFTNLAYDDLMCTFKQIMTANSMEGCMVIHEEVPAQFVVYTKDTMEEVGRFQLDYFFGFHLINAFEDGDKLVMDFMTPEAGKDPFKSSYVEILNATSPNYRENYNNYGLVGTTPERVVLDLSAPQVGRNPNLADSWKMMDTAVDNDKWMTYMQAGSDFPNVLAKDRYNKDYDQFWSSGLGGLSVVDRVYRTKMSTMERQVWQEVGHHMSDTKIVTSPDGSESVVVSLVTPVELSEETPSAFVVILDAFTLEEVGRAELPENVRVCLMTHSYWVEGSHETNDDDDNSSSSLRQISLLPLLTLFIGLLDLN